MAAKSKVPSSQRDSTSYWDEKERSGSRKYSKQISVKHQPKLRRFLKRYGFILTASHKIGIAGSQVYVYILVLVLNFKPPVLLHVDLTVSPVRLHWVNIIRTISIFHQNVFLKVRNYFIINIDSNIIAGN